MSDTQDDLTALIAELKDAQASDVTLDLTIGNNGTLQRAIEALERAHFQRRAEPVAESTKTNLIDESGGYWVDGEFRIEGKDLDAMLDRLYTSPPIPPDVVMVPECVWTQEDDDYGSWRTGCGGHYIITEGTPEENEMKFCTYCGGKLSAAPKEGT